MREDLKRNININNNTINPNQLIIGENLVAIKELLKTHTNKIDFIYIDPPYNTGKNLIYKNRYKHEQWIKMMHSRLVIAEKLLSDDGVIFISINDYEQAYLKVLMDKIFINFLGTIIWLNSVVQSDAHNIQNNHEYIHVYAKKENKILLTSKRKIMLDELHYDKKGSYIITSNLISASANLNKCPTLGSSIYWRERDNSFIFLDDYDKQKAKTSNDYNEIYQPPNKALLAAGYQCIRPPKKGNKIMCWSRSRSTLSLKDGVVIKKSNNKLVPYRKKYQNGNWIHYQNIRSLIEGKFLGSAYGTTELKSILVNKMFDYAKPVKLMERLIEAYYKKDFIILDFFAGSAPLAEAVFRLNRKDGAKRKFILVTNNENNIAYDVTYERIYRIIKGKGTNGETNFKWIKNNKPFLNENLRVFILNE